MIWVFAGMGIMVRTDRVGPEKEMTELGKQEWLIRATCGDNARPRGS